MADEDLGAWTIGQWWYPEAEAGCIIMEGSWAVQADMQEDKNCEN